MTFGRASLPLPLPLSGASERAFILINNLPQDVGGRAAAAQVLSLDSLLPIVVPFPLPPILSC